MSTKTTPRKNKKSVKNLKNLCLEYLKILKRNSREKSLIDLAKAYSQVKIIYNSNFIVVTK